jgi:hypothetical protein
MILLQRAAVSLLLMVAVACGGEPAPAVDTAVDSVPDSVDSTPETTSPAAALDSPESAVSVLRAYYAAIARGNYSRAFVLWADSGAASGQTLDEFQRGYAETASVDVGIGLPGQIEGAAGSRYIGIPVELRARRVDGGEQCFRGSYTLRLSVVPGAIPEQRAWRIYSADLASCGEQDTAQAATVAVSRAGLSSFGGRAPDL